MKRFLCLFLIILMTLTSIPAFADNELAKGSKGNAVLKLQERLNELGFSVGAADGDYGNKTYNAIVEFQIVNGLTITGVADETTQNALFSNSAKSPLFGTAKEDAVDELRNKLGDPNTGLTRSGAFDDGISISVGDDGFLMVEIGSNCPFWFFDLNTSNWKAICAMLYSYSEEFDNYTYVNDHSGDVICFKTAINNYNDAPLTERVYKESEICDYLKLISEKTRPYLEVDDETIPVQSESEEDWSALIEAFKGLGELDKNGDGLSMDELFKYE